MAQIKEEYVSFETAKLLKEKGFNEPCICYSYGNSMNNYFSKPRIIDGANSDASYILLPTQQMAMKWLREVHGLHISLEPCYDYDSMHVVFLAFVQNVADVHEFMDGRKNVATHPNAEKSCELAIKYCLENLI